MPWFMTVFGRDTLITCYQTLLFGPELARSGLDVLAELQATEDDPTIDAEPGKIVHEVREGKAAKTWFHTYYGSVDATPLYLILLSEVWRWTDDAAMLRELKEPAMRALAWIDEYGDLDGDGFVEYKRRTDRGLENQSWKDSGDSQRFHDGSLARGPIAPCEVQGYVYDAKRRTAEMAREVWRDRGLADRLERDAEELRRAFDEKFWTERRGGYYVLALDGEKRQVDSLCSNIGHLLWSGIVPRERVDPIVDALMGEELWSGWGVRTMSEGDAAYNPLSYHNGTVWPHDNSLIAVGLARYGRWAGGAADCPPDADGRRALPVPAAGGVRGAGAPGDAFSDCLSDSRAPAGLGRRHTRAAAAGAARPTARPRPPRARDAGAGRATLMGWPLAPADRRPGLRPPVGRARRGLTRHRRRSVGTSPVGGLSRQLLA
jgi:glycogen debranching enzyme